LTFLPRQMFHPDIHYSITSARLSHNQLSGSILSDSFVTFPGIHLDLSYNSLTKVEYNAFTSSLRRAPFGPNSPNSDSSLLPLTDNNVISSHHSTIENSKKPSALPSSQVGLSLFLRKNRLSQLSKHAFAQSKFSLVDLSHNLLSEFDFSVFGDHTIIGGVNISHNSVRKILAPESDVGFSHVITSLDASHNRLEDQGIRELRRVCATNLMDLSHNGIRKIDAAMFPPNCTLKVRLISLLNFPVFFLEKNFHLIELDKGSQSVTFFSNILLPIHSFV